MAAQEEVTLAAMKAAQHGWRVYPLRPHSKRPAFARWQDIATLDPRVIELWWDDLYRDCGLGAIPPAHVIRVDVDTREDGDGWETISRWGRAGYQLEPTVTARTPRGGHHLYYTTSALDLVSTALGPRVEFKVGPTVLPPTPGYEWCPLAAEFFHEAPEWLIAASRRGVAADREERAKAGHTYLSSLTLDELAWRIEGATGQPPRRTRIGLAFRCPAHDDRNASAYAFEGDHGVRVACSAGCPPALIAAPLHGAAS